MAIFSKFFGDVMSHIIRSNADKIINTIPELFIKQKIVFNFVYFSSSQTLCWFLDKNLANFVSPAWKLDNPYCHNAEKYKRLNCHCSIFLARPTACCSRLSEKKLRIINGEIFLARYIQQNILIMQCWWPWDFQFFAHSLHKGNFWQDFEPQISPG